MMRLRSIIRKILRRNPVILPLAFEDLTKAQEHRGVRWHPIVDSATPPRPFTRSLSDTTIDWSSYVSEVHPPMGVVELPAGYRITGSGWPLSKEGIIIPDTTWYGGAYGEIKHGPELLPAKRVSGTVLSLLSDFSHHNYYHFLVDALGRFALYEQAAPNLPAIDFVLCPRPFTRRLERWIDMLGVDRSRIIPMDAGDVIRADRTLVPSFPGERRDTTALAVDFWRRRRFGERQFNGVRKIYLPRRSTTRALTNDKEVEAALHARGFETLELTARAEPEMLFAEAKIVVGVHGAGLTDCMFSPPDAWMLEIVPSDHIYPYYYSLAGATGLRYAYLVAQSEGQRDPQSWGPSPHNLTVDIDALLRGIDSLEAEDTNQQSSTVTHTLR